MAALQQKLGISYNDPALLEQALVHSSYINEYPGTAPGSNEKLEFFGDAVLGLVIADKLYRDYARFSEGEMTRLRAALVRQEALSRVAKTINLGEYLYLGRGEESSGGRNKPRNLASALEAVIATIFLDQGITITGKVILALFDGELKKALSHGAVADYKSQLQELVQSKQQEIPVYYLVESIGPAHKQTFTIEVRVAGNALGRGSGKSKKLAEKEAARSALEKLLPDFTP